MDPEAFLAEHGPGLLRLAVMLTGVPADGEDLLQTTLLRLLPQWDRVRGADVPSAYVRRCLVNAFVSQRRRSRREVPWADGYDPAAPAPRSPSETDVAWAWLATLPPAQRAVLALRYYEDLPDGDIAECLGCTASTVRSNAARALATLRATLGAKETSR